MHDETPLIALIAVGLVLSFICGYIAVRLRLSPILGYLVAGIIMGPYTPGFVGESHIASELAEIGVILLMFGVGMHFSVGDLWAMRNISVPGAVIQIIVATLLGVGVAAIWGWSFTAGLIFGLALSVASTVVLLRSLEATKQVNTPDGKIAVGWLVVEDLIMVLVLVLLPAFFGQSSDEAVKSGHIGEMPLWLSLGMALGKVALFIAFMLIFGTRFFPWLLQLVERTAPRELFTLVVVALAIGVAFGSSELFGCSLALGAFFAGVVVHRSDLNHHAATTLQPLQDAFGTCFSSPSACSSTP